MTMDMDDPSLTAGLMAVRAVHFASCLLIGAVWSFELWIDVRPPPQRRRAGLRVLRIATLLAAMSGFAWFVLVAAAMGGTDLRDALHWGVLRIVGVQTQFGRAWQWHAMFLFVGAITTVVRVGARRIAWLGWLASLGLVGTLAWAGHGDTGPAPHWHRAADVLHLVVCIAWPAGLLPYGLALRTLINSDDPSRWTTIYRLTRRFSATSLIAVGLLVASGIINSGCLVGSVHDLFASRYGQVLIVKLLLFMGMLGCGAVNRLVLTSRLVDGERPARQLWRSVAIELVLGVGVIAVVGILGTLEPGRH